MSVSLLLLLTACVSRFVHVSPHGIWAVITLCETLGYVGIICVMGGGRRCYKSPLPFSVSYDFWAEDRKQHLDYLRFVRMYMNKQGVLFIVNLFGYLHSCTHISSDIRLCDSG